MYPQEGSTFCLLRPPVFSRDMWACILPAGNFNVNVLV